MWAARLRRICRNPIAIAFQATSSLTGATFGEEGGSSFLIEGKVSLTVVVSLCPPHYLVLPRSCSPAPQKLCWEPPQRGAPKNQLLCSTKVPQVLSDSLLLVWPTPAELQQLSVAGVLSCCSVAVLWSHTPAISLWSWSSVMLPVSCLISWGALPICTAPRLPELRVPSSLPLNATCYQYQSDKVTVKQRKAVNLHIWEIFVSMKPVSSVSINFVVEPSCGIFIYLHLWKSVYDSGVSFFFHSIHCDFSVQDHYDICIYV